MKTSTQYPYTKQTADGLATYWEPTFRTYPRTWGSGPNDTWGWIQVCASLEGGKWESFVTFRVPKGA